MGLYFNKIQCFCFEEQRLEGFEEIDMPIFFYLDPALLDDPSTEDATNVTLAYTFFKTGDERDDQEGDKNKDASQLFDAKALIKENAHKQRVPPADVAIPTSNVNIVLSGSKKQ